MKRGRVRSKVRVKGESMKSTSNQMIMPSSVRSKYNIQILRKEKSSALWVLGILRALKIVAAYLALAILGHVTFRFSRFYVGL